MTTWDPDRYLTYAGERGRPFVDLLGRIGAAGPRRVVDLGCGPGGLTALLARHWPGAEVRGVDSSPEMIERARRDDGGIDGGIDVGAVVFELGDLRSWRPPGPVDVLVSNATLQWLPEHLTLLPSLVDTLSDDGWLALQVPGNHDAPSHRLLRELAADERFADHTRRVARPLSHDPEVYAATLLDLGLAVDVWETTYLHLLPCPDPVFTWISGTGARPVLQALPPALRAEFEDEFRALLREAYPPSPHGTVLPFRRIFAVAHRVDGAAG